MGIDKETKPTYVNIILDKNPKYLKTLSDQAEEDGQNETSKDEEPRNRLSLTMDKHSFDMEEYYFDENDNEIFISGTMKSSEGESYVCITIPLSDIVLIDILEHACKKLNKLKNVMESLK